MSLLNMRELPLNAKGGPDCDRTESISCLTLLTAINADNTTHYPPKRSCRDSIVKHPLISWTVPSNSKSIFKFWQVIKQISTSDWQTYR